MDWSRTSLSVTPSARPHFASGAFVLTHQTEEQDKQGTGLTVSQSKRTTTTIWKKKKVPTHCQEGKRLLGFLKMCSAQNPS